MYIYVYQLNSFAFKIIYCREENGSIIVFHFLNEISIIIFNILVNSHIFSVRHLNKMEIEGII